MLLPHGRLIARRQTNVAQDNEKGSRHQNNQAESSKKITQVGHTLNVRKDATAAAADGGDARSIRRLPSDLAAWFKDETFEVTADPSSSGKIGLPAGSKALGDGLSELPRIHREVYLDNRGKAEPKFEGSQRWLELTELIGIMKKLLKG